LVKSARSESDPRTSTGRRSSSPSVITHLGGNTSITHNFMSHPRRSDQGFDHLPLKVSTCKHASTTSMRTTRPLLSSARSKDALSLLFLGGDAFSIGVLEPLLANKQGLWKDLLIVTSGEKQIGRGSRGTRRIVREL
jgi:hypothetical protein